MGHTGTGPHGSSNDSTAALAERLSKIPGFLAETEEPVFLKDVPVGTKCRLWMFPNQSVFVVGVSCDNASEIYCAFDSGSIGTRRADTPVVILEHGPKLTDDDMAALKRLPKDYVDILWGRSHAETIGVHPSANLLFGLFHEHKARTGHDVFASRRTSPDGVLCDVCLCLDLERRDTGN